MPQMIPCISSEDECNWISFQDLPTFHAALHYTTGYPVTREDQDSAARGGSVTSSDGRVVLEITRSRDE
ncbi:unnamed protein product [Toxocara canis]|uniref:Spt4 domain-containing protein n=1 Tax=Toxocara canis TaxID=6265 RepID=A0A183UCX5_TOXCA|nr:unnamed protein product [Toxocara canis]